MKVSLWAVNLLLRDVPIQKDCHSHKDCEYLNADAGFNTEITVLKSQGDY